MARSGPHCSHARVSCLALACLTVGGVSNVPPAGREVVRAASMRCDSIQSARDTVEYQVFLTLEVPTVRVYDTDGKLHQDTVSDAFRTLMLQTIRQNFIPPRAPELSVYMTGFDSSPPTAVPGVFGQVMFSLTPTGGLAESELVQSSLSPAFDRGLMDALHRADSAGGFPLPQDAGAAKIARLFVVLCGGRDLPPHAALLFKLRVPAWHNVTDAAPDPSRPGIQPQYPQDLVQRGFEGTFVLQFVIDEHGNVVPTTIALVRSDIKRPSDLHHVDRFGQEPQLGDFVRAVLPAARGDHYIPATIDGCPVKSLAERPFVFKVKR